jgi:hypothetical protein
MYDIVFISYDEKNADQNYSALKEKYPFAKRVNGVKGIHQAHIAAAKLSLSNMFWVVDGDAIIKDDFNFKYNPGKYNLDTVHIWYSENPVNGLTYGYGGVKLLPKKETLEMDIDSADMTTSISKYIKIIPQVSNITAFNTDPFSTWRSAFRECVKLSSKVIKGQVDNETQQRLEIWCSIGNDKLFGKFAISGALAGREYGYANKKDVKALALINDFDFLKKQFKVA